MTNPKSQATASAVPMLSFGGTDIADFKVQAIRAAVVYGDKSRVVLHIHHAVTLGKNEPPSDKDVEARALKLATLEFERMGVDIAERLKALAVDPDALLAGVEYRVDKTGRELVPITPPRGRRTRGAGSKRRASKT